MVCIMADLCSQEDTRNSHQAELPGLDEALQPWLYSCCMALLHVLAHCFSTEFERVPSHLGFGVCNLSIIWKMTLPPTTQANYSSVFWEFFYSY